MSFEGYFELFIIDNARGCGGQPVYGQWVENGL
jgi:hypothetical protein